MRWMIAVVSAGLLAGCASRVPPPRTSLHRAPRPAQSQSQSQYQPATTRPQAQPSSGTPIKLDTPTPAPAGPGSNIPLEGFRPMRSQSRSGA